jgi:hypothetical protein
MSPLAALLYTTLAASPEPAAGATPETTVARESEDPGGPAHLDLDEKRLLVFVAGRGATRLMDADPSFGGSGQLGIGIRVVRGLFIQAEVGEGVYGGPGESVGTIIAGLRYEVRSWGRLRPSAFVGFTHAHQSSLRDLGAAPFATLAGAADTIEHRTGIQGDLMLRIPFPSHWRGPLPRFSTVVRGDVGYYFDDVAAPLHLGVGAGLSVTF